MAKDYRLSHAGDRKSCRYEYEIYKTGLYDDQLWQWEKALLIRETEKLQEKKRIVSYLDFACGTGRILAALEKYAEHAYGVDISSSMLELARKKIQKAELIEADITKNDVLEGKVFDLLTAFRFFLNAGPVLGEEALAVLVPKLDRDGIFIFNMHGNLWSHRIFTKLYFLLRGRALNTASYWQIKKMLVRHGLKIERWYGFGLAPKTFYRWFGARTMYTADSFFATVPLMKYISYNLIFVVSHDTEK